MANPNIVNVTDIRGKTAVAEVTTLSSILVQNSPASDTVLKLNALYISNVDGANTATVNAGILRSDNTFYIAKTITVPADATLDILSKSVYLEEGDSLVTESSANSALQAVCSYEIIS